MKTKILAITKAAVCFVCDGAAEHGGRKRNKKRERNKRGPVRERAIRQLGAVHKM